MTTLEANKRASLDFRTRKLFCVAVAACVAILRVSASAQDKNAQPTPSHITPHRFFDTVNVALTGMETGALLADGITTQHVLNADPTHRLAKETDPIARPFVYAGWPGQIAGGALFVAADVALRYLLHRHNHHRLERWLPAVLTTYGALGAIHNAEYWRITSQQQHRQ
jgi:hypothetical protein